jgi:hypothetical protein
MEVNGRDLAERAMRFVHRWAVFVLIALVAGLGWQIDRLGDHLSRVEAAAEDSVKAAEAAEELVRAATLQTEEDRAFTEAIRRSLVTIEKNRVLLCRLVGEEQAPDLCPGE